MTGINGCISAAVLPLLGRLHRNNNVASLGFSGVNVSDVDIIKFMVTPIISTEHELPLEKTLPIVQELCWL